MTGPWRCARWFPVLLLWIATGCATANDARMETGIRSGFEAVSVGRIAVLPFAASDPFSMTDEARDDMIARYEKSAQASLGTLGFDYATIDEVQATFNDEERDAQLARIDIDRPLVELFEPSIAQSGSLEDDRIIFIRELAEKMGVESVLVGQIVYHTEAQCAGDGSRYTPHVVYEPGEPTSPNDRVPCVVSHFEAKLVHGKTGRTIWYNRALREVRAATPKSPLPDTMANADTTVGLVLADAKKGLGSILAAR